jgi:hypothetical protein
MGAEELPTVEEEEKERLSPPAQPIDLGAVNGALGFDRNGVTDADDGTPSRGTGVLRRGSFEEWSHSHPAHAGVRAAMTAEKHEHEDASGDATPRRLGSPPPHALNRLASPPPRTTIVSDDEDEGEDDGDAAGDDDVVEPSADDEGVYEAEAADRPTSPSATSSKENSPTAVRRRASDFAFRGRPNQPPPSILGFVKRHPEETGQ